jgi:hypothetical protein
MAIQIEVRQNEVIVVRGQYIAEVSHLFTVGMNPCIGLVLWGEDICALGHFHDWESIEQCAPLISHFMECSGKASRKAVIVKAPAAVGGKHAWHSEAMKCDLMKMIPGALPVNIVSKAPSDDAAKVKVTLADGKLDYLFSYEKPDVIKRDPENASWTTKPEVLPYILFGFYMGNRTIFHQKGSEEYKRP